MTYNLSLLRFLFSLKILMYCSSIFYNFLWFYLSSLHLSYRSEINVSLEMSLLIADSMTFEEIGFF